MTPAVVVVGDVATDVVVVLAGEPAPGSDRPAAISTRGGGAAANVAAHLARLGMSVELAGCVGDDPPAAGLAAELTAAGVRLALRTVPGVPTGTIVSLVEPGGQRSFLADRGANLALLAGDVPAPVGRRAPLRVRVHPAGPPPPDAGLHALRDAVAAGCTVSVDPASTGPLAEYGVDRWLADTGGATLLLPNADEARLLTGCGTSRSRTGAGPGVSGGGAEARSRRRAVGRGRRPGAPAGAPDDRRRHHRRRGRVRRRTALGLARRPEGDPAAALDAGLARAAAVVRQPGAR